jgi:DNA-binding transcriptional LysR family regulator
MDKLKALQYFVSSAEGGSFAAAARRHEVSVAAVHKLVSRLELQLGARLFERHARGLTLTSQGAAYRDSCRPLLDALDEVDMRVQRATAGPSGTLVLGAPPQLMHHFLLPALPSFVASHPGIDLDTRVVHRATDPDAQAVDVFLLHGWPEPQDLVHRKLGHARTVVAATPEYWSRHGLPQQPQDLARHPCLLMRNPAGTLLDLWEFQRGSERLAVKVSGWLSSNDREVVLDTVLAHHGVGRFNLLTTQALLRSGQLVPVLRDWEVQGGPPLNLLIRPSQRRAPRVRLFVDYVLALLLAYEAEEGRVGERGAVERPVWHWHRYGRASSVLRKGG